MTTPVGGGIRSLNVALRQELDLYVCLRPVRWFRGVPSPLQDPSKVDMVIFRENTEDIYAGIEWPAESDAAAKADRVPSGRDGRDEDPLPRDLRDRHQADLARGHAAARPRARSATRSSTTAGRSRFVHKGNIMKFTEGAFRDWGYEVAADEFGATPLDGGPWMTLREPGDRARHRRQGRDRGRVPAADPAPPGRVRRDRDDEPERRLHLRRARRAGRRHRHRARRQPLRRGRGVRGDARDRARSTRARTRSTPAR